MNPLGRNAARIESEYLERLHKVRFGLDRGWRPPGLMLKEGTSGQRAGAMQRLKELAEQDRFYCSYVALGPDLQLRDTEKVCRAAITAVGFSPESSAPDARSALRIRARSVRQSGRDGWVVLIDNIDRFHGSTRERAASYREITRWMGTLAEESDSVGLFCVIAVTPEFEAAVADPRGDRVAIDAKLRPAGSEAERQLLDAAMSGIGSLEHELVVKELLVLE